MQYTPFLSVQDCIYEAEDSYCAMAERGIDTHEFLKTGKRDVSVYEVQLKAAVLISSLHSVCRCRIHTV